MVGEDVTRVGVTVGLGVATVGDGVTGVEAGVATCLTAVGFGAFIARSAVAWPTPPPVRIWRARPTELRMTAVKLAIVLAFMISHPSMLSS